MLIAYFFMDFLADVRDFVRKSLIMDKGQRDKMIAGCVRRLRSLDEQFFVALVSQRGKVVIGFYLNLTSCPMKIHFRNFGTARPIQVLPYALWLQPVDVLSMVIILPTIITTVLLISALIRIFDVTGSPLQSVELK
jgi:hypothetical protein